MPLATANHTSSAAGLFDQAREGKLEAAPEALTYAAEELLTDAYREIVHDTASYSFTGKSFDELPEDFQKDYAVWDAGFKRILEPFSLKGGLQLVDAFGNLFDLWGEQ